MAPKRNLAEGSNNKKARIEITRAAASQKVDDASKEVDEDYNIIRAENSVLKSIIEQEFPKFKDWCVAKTEKGEVGWGEEGQNASITWRIFLDRTYDEIATWVMGGGGIPRKDRRGGSRGCCGRGEASVVGGCLSLSFAMRLKGCQLHLLVTLD